MAQNSQSSTAGRATVPGTANDEPVAPSLFTAPPRREYIPDTARVGEAPVNPELLRAREAFDAGDFRTARSEARRLLKDRAAPAAARSEAADLIDRTDIDQGPIAAAVAFVILAALLLMFFAMNGK